jgi:hypothetical protein
MVDEGWCCAAAALCELLRAQAAVCVIHAFVLTVQQLSNWVLVLRRPCCEKLRVWGSLGESHA